VGFGIAYSVVKGNAKASIRGISKVADSRASFFVLFRLISIRGLGIPATKVVPDTYSGAEKDEKSKGIHGALAADGRTLFCIMQR
jgi:hypothetical protein